MTKFKLEIEFEANSDTLMAQLVEELASCVDDGDRIEITDWEIMEAESASPQLSPRTFLSRTLCSTELHILYSIARAAQTATGANALGEEEAAIARKIELLTLVPAVVDLAR